MPRWARRLGQSVDRKRGTVRLALGEDGSVSAALFIARRPVALSRGYLSTQIGTPPIPGLLAAHPGFGPPDTGAVICAFSNVGVTTMTKAIAGRSLMTVEALGAAVKAGTNCGSCRPG